MSHFSNFILTTCKDSKNSWFWHGSGKNFVNLHKISTMRHIFKHILAAFVLFWGTQATFGQALSPLATYMDDNGEEQTMEPGGSYTGSAPIEVSFDAGVTEVGDYTPHFEWRFYEGSDVQNPYLIRYDETTSYTFTKAGMQHVALTVSFVNGSDTIRFTTDDFPPLSFPSARANSSFPMPSRPMAMASTMCSRPRAPTRVSWSFRPRSSTAGDRRFFLGQPCGGMGRHVPWQTRQGWRLFPQRGCQGSGRTPFPYSQGSQPVAHLQRGCGIRNGDGIDLPPPRKPIDCISTDGQG